MKKDELFAAANTLRQNGDISLLDIANAMNLKDQIITPEQKNDLEMVARLNKAGIKDVENELKRLKAIEDEGLKAVTENKLTAEFGPLERKDKSVNLVRQYAEGKYSNGVSFEDIKNDAIYKQLKAADADYTSAQNELEVSETKREEKKDASSVVIY